VATAAVVAVAAWTVDDGRWTMAKENRLRRACVFGNILLDTTGCVEITVRVEAPDGGGTATTHCVRQ